MTSFEKIGIKDPTRDLFLLGFQRQMSRFKSTIFTVSDDMTILRSVFLVWSYTLWRRQRLHLYFPVSTPIVSDVSLWSKMFDSILVMWFSIRRYNVFCHLWSTCGRGTEDCRKSRDPDEKCNQDTIYFGNDTSTVHRHRSTKIDWGLEMILEEAKHNSELFIYKY